MFALKRVLVIALFILSLVAATSHASASPLFSEPSKHAVFLSPLERWMPTWNLNGYVSQLERAGYHVDVFLNENVSIAFLGTELGKYDIIILRTDSFMEEGDDFYCSGDPVTNETRTTFAGEIAAGELHVGACVGFGSIFLERSYPANSLRPGLVYVVGGDTELASAFLEGGSSVFISYYQMYSLQWGRMDALATRLLGYLSQGYSVKEAVIQLHIYLYTGHGVAADWPSLYWTGDGNFKI